MEAQTWLRKRYLQSGDVEKITGLKWSFIRTYIPIHLTPTRWKEWSDAEKVRHLQIPTAVLFENKEVERFMRHLFFEYMQMHLIEKRMQSLEAQFGRVCEVLNKMDKYLFNLNEFMSLEELANELNYKNYRSLSNKLEIFKDQSGDYAILKIPGFTFRFTKVKGRWHCSRFDFYKQRQALGMQKVYKYFGNHQHPGDGK